jgi:hypothetical protein
VTLNVVSNISCVVSGADEAEEYEDEVAYLTETLNLGDVSE